MAKEKPSFDWKEEAVEEEEEEEEDAIDYHSGSKPTTLEDIEAASPSEQSESHSSSSSSNSNSSLSIWQQALTFREEISEMNRVLLDKYADKFQVDKSSGKRMAPTAPPNAAPAKKPKTRPDTEAEKKVREEFEGAVREGNRLQDYEKAEKEGFKGWESVEYLQRYFDFPRDIAMEINFGVQPDGKAARKTVIQQARLKGIPAEFIHTTTAEILKPLASAAGDMASLALSERTALWANVIEENGGSIWHILGNTIYETGGNLLGPLAETLGSLGTSLLLQNVRKNVGKINTDAMRSYREPPPPVPVPVPKAQAKAVLRRGARNR